MGPDEQTVVTATQLVRDFAQVRRMAESGPVHVSSHGHTELVVLGANIFDKFQSNNDPDVSRIEAKFETVMQSIETMVAILDQNLCIRRVNTAYLETLDVIETEIIGKSIEELATTPSDHFLIHRIGDVCRSGIAEVLTHPSWNRPGRTLRIKIRPWHMGVAIFSDDVTERVQARDRIGEDISLDHALSAIPGVGVAKVKSCGTILSGSIGLARMLGTSEAALVGMRVQQIFDPRSRLQVEDALTQSSMEPARCQVEYLRQGIDCAKCTLIVSPFWSSEHRASATMILHDPQLYAESL